MLQFPELISLENEIVRDPRFGTSLPKKKRKERKRKKKKKKKKKKKNPPPLDHNGCGVAPRTPLDVGSSKLEMIHSRAGNNEPPGGGGTKVGDLFTATYAPPEMDETGVRTVLRLSLMMRRINSDLGVKKANLPVLAIAAKSFGNSLVWGAWCMVRPIQ